MFISVVVMFISMSVSISIVWWLMWLLRLLNMKLLSGCDM